MVNVVVMVGLPASGKSSFAQSLAQEEGYIRFNMDDTRNQLGFPAGSPFWTKEKEKFAFEHMLSGIGTAVSQGSNVVIDNTHLNRRWCVRYKQTLQFFDVEWTVKNFLDVSVEECIRRDSLREGSAHVGEKVIRGMVQGHFKSIQRGDIVTEEWLNEPLFEIKKYQGTTGADRTLVVDLDGTLALMGDRGPYEFWKVGRDTLNLAVVRTIRAFRAMGYRIVLCSGRDGDYRAQTEQWLIWAGVLYDDLFMRPAGDSRRDSIVKHELFWQHIAPKYDVALWLDDRNQVVDTVRAMGISCFQVNPGNF